MNIPKKDELLCRSLLWNRLMNINYPMDKIDARVDQAWMGYLIDARNINSYMDSLKKNDLAGHTTAEQIEEWS